MNLSDGFKMWSLEMILRGREGKADKQTMIWWGTRTIIDFFTKNLLLKSAVCEGTVQDPLVGKKFRPPAVSDFPELGHKISSWVWPGETYIHCIIHFAIKEKINIVMTFDFGMCLAGWSWRFPLHVLLLCFILKNSAFIRNDVLVVCQVIIHEF